LFDFPLRIPSHDRILQKLYTSRFFFVCFMNVELYYIISMDESRDMNLEVSILYVEDEALTRAVFARILGRKVRNLFQAENGEEGLELFKKHRPDIVISDVKMPVMDGIEMSRKIKSLDSNVKIILTTAHSDASVLLNSIDAGIDKYILKPVDVDVLFSAMENCARTVMLERKIQEQNKEKDELISRLQDALDNIKKLSGLLPICSSCKKIRDDKGYWNQIEQYIAEHSEAEFSHGICPDCVRKLYPQYKHLMPEK
jgi:sigma-B regulation protein RsbU (phosphoserine phosphatase)